jgi:predicted metal-dependent hydrolase
MTTNAAVMTVGPFEVTVVRKPIKHLHLAVYPPDGHVRLAAPIETPEPVLQAAVAKRLGWIRRQRVRFAGQARESRREFVSGETLWLLGRRYRLRVVEAGSRRGVHVAGRYVELRGAPGANRSQREARVDTWWRQELRAVAGPLIERWSETLEVRPADWRIRRMKTKWGSCNAESGRLWLNAELACKPLRCIEYVVVHELIHLVERRHGPVFQALMDRHLPDWRSRRAELGILPLGHQEWD